MTNKQAQELLIQNGQLVADTLRHLADNEIDSDYFAITSTSENGTETEHELVITEYARQAAGTVDELVKALEAKDKAWSAQDDHINQQADRIESLEQKNAGLGKALGDAEKRIAEFDQRIRTQNRHACELFDEAKAQRQRVAELEALTAPAITVTLPAGYAVRPGHPINEAERGVMIPKGNGPWLSRHDVEHVLRVAGIRINGE